MAKLVLKKARTKKDSPASSPSPPGQHELPMDRDARIAARAYALFERRGRTHGCDVEDWLQAEKELSESNVVPR